MVPEYYVGDTWTVDDTSVVTISGFEDSADVTAVGAGSANVIGHWDVYTYTFQHNLDGPYCDTSSEVTAPTAPVGIFSVVLALRSFGSVSTDNTALSTYSSTYGTTSLGGFFSMGTGDNVWREGVEITGTVIPSSFTGAVVIHRKIIALRLYIDNDSTPYQTLINQDDTSLAEFRDADPQSGGSAGRVYDVDAPGLGTGSGAPVGSIVRIRVNFYQYTTAGGITLPQSTLYWYLRQSIIKTSSGDQLLNDISGDNTVGIGSTALTWNLQ
jgi:hypothetical protein